MILLGAFIRYLVSLGTGRSGRGKPDRPGCEENLADRKTD